MVNLLENLSILGKHVFNPRLLILQELDFIMKAKFATSCVSCGDKIQPGKEISKNKDDKWVHKHCAEDSEGLP